MTSMAWLLLAGMLVLDTASHLLLKASSVAAHDDARPIHFLRRMIQRPTFWAAIALFLAMLVVWIAFYSLVPLAQGVMTGCITIAGVMLGGRVVFGEPITRARALAATLIAVGVVLVGWERG